MLNEFSSSPVRTLVVDDAPLMRKVIPQILGKHPRIEVVGTAANGRECLTKILELRPDVVTLDMDMPVMNGITTIKNIMVRYQIPIVIVSSLIQDGYFAFEALRLGVVDFVPKPSGGSGGDLGFDEELIRQRVHAASSMHVQCVRRVRRNKRGPAPNCSEASGPPAVVVVGTTLAGPNTIMHILSRLGTNFPGAVVCLQEIHPRILTPFCSCFHEITPMEVQPVTDEHPMRPGVVYMASTANGVRIGASSEGGPHGRLSVYATEPNGSPIDQLFESAAEHFKDNTCGVLLSGLGANGVDGMRKIKEMGGITIAEHQDGCAYPSLVQNAVEHDVVDSVLTEEGIANRLDSWIRAKTNASEPS
jgi:two-component system chemotaxis response regulator CheB